MTNHFFSYKETNEHAQEFTQIYYLLEDVYRFEEFLDIIEQFRSGTTA